MFGELKTWKEWAPSFTYTRAAMASTKPRVQCPPKPGVTSQALLAGIGQPCLSLRYWLRWPC